MQEERYANVLALKRLGLMYQKMVQKNENQCLFPDETI